MSNIQQYFYLVSRCHLGCCGPHEAVSSTEDSTGNFTFSSFLIRNKQSTEESELASMHTSTSCQSDRIRLVVDSIDDRTVAATELGPIGGQESMEKGQLQT